MLIGTKTPAFWPFHSISLTSQLNLLMQRYEKLPNRHPVPGSFRGVDTRGAWNARLALRQRKNNMIEKRNPRGK